MDPVGRALALIALAAALGGEGEAPPRTQDPAPRAAIGRFTTIDCASLVVYADAPDVPHRLNATYVFPDRARWWLGIGPEDSPERHMRMRLGSRVHALDPASAVSRELLAEERTEALVLLEMRRALLLWPLGFEWQRTGNASTAPLARLGRLTARFADERAANPDALEFTAEDGSPGDQLRAITWRADGDKAWPVTLELWHANARVWSETVRAIDTKTRFIDSFFLPSDKRDVGVSTPVATSAVRGTDLPECRVQRIALKPECSLEAALVEWRGAAEGRGKALAALGLALEDKTTIEIDRDARPTALVLRLQPAKGPLPDEIARDFELVPERPGLVTSVVGLPSVERGLVTRLLAAVPADAAPGQAYLRLDPKAPGGHVLIVLPLHPGDSPRK